VTELRVTLAVFVCFAAAMGHTEQGSVVSLVLVVWYCVLAFRGYRVPVVTFYFVILLLLLSLVCDLLSMPRLGTEAGGVWLVAAHLTMSRRNCDS
jgi:hypothetical protein